MKAKPTKDWVLIKPLSSEEKTKQGIHIPFSKNSEDMITKATVVSVGPEVQDVEEGDNIVYNQVGAQQTGVGTLIREKAIKAKF